MAKVMLSTEVWSGKQGREGPRRRSLVGGRGGGAHSGSQEAALGSCPFSPPADSAAGFHLRSLSLVKQRSKAEEARPLSCPVGAPAAPAHI